jgi:hypothetical protein
MDGLVKVRRAGAVHGVLYLDGRAAVQLSRRFKIRAGRGAGLASAADEKAEAAEDASGRPWRAGRGAEEVLDDRHGEKHRDEDGRGHEPERHRAHAAV